MSHPPFNARMSEVDMVTCEVRPPEIDALLSGQKVSHAFFDVKVNINWRLLFVESLPLDAPAGKKPRQVMANVTYYDWYENPERTAMISVVSFALIGEAHAWPDSPEKLKELLDATTPTTH